MERMLITDEDIKKYVNKNKDKWLKEKEEKKSKLESLFSSYDYMNWLNRFTAKHENFCDDDFIYFFEELPKMI